MWELLASRRPLPMQFKLLGSRRRGNQLCAALQVKLDENHSVFRLLDPEPRQPYVSLSGIFAYSNLSLIEGLLKFDLQRSRGDFDLTQAGFEPFDEIWTTFGIARKIAGELGLTDLLSGILDWKTRFAWSLDEGQSLVHNWRVPSTILNPLKYSTGSLLETSIPFIELTSADQQVRTLVSSDQRSNPPSTSSVEQRIIRWSVLAYEDFLESKQESIEGGKGLISKSSSKESKLLTSKSDEVESLIPDFGALLNLLKDVLNDDSTQKSKDLKIGEGEGAIIVTTQELIATSSNSIPLHDLGSSTAQNAKHRLALIHLLDRLTRKISNVQTTTVISPPSSPIRAVTSPNLSSPTSRQRSGSTSNPGSGIMKSPNVERRMDNLELSMKRMENGLAILIEQNARLSTTDLKVKTLNLTQTASENAMNAIFVVMVGGILVLFFNALGNTL